jgi:predicted unusual protein kinase regulating ubiquinone biosynthesis (AarF/ABC1/UbiB family)
LPITAAVAHLFALVWLQARLVASYLWLFVRTTVLRAPLSAERLSALHRRNARRFKETACRLKGANVKIGQLASMQAHLLPPEYVEELRALRDAVEPTPFAAVAAIIAAELGGPPHEVFAEFDETPIAAASMAQVHAARLKTGEKVVVKVLHPGLERSVAIDLALMGLLLRAVSLFFRKVDLLIILRESEEPLRRELDLELEGKATEEIGRDLERIGVLVPKVHWPTTRRRVITLGFIDGANVDCLPKLRAWNVDRVALMQSYLGAFLYQGFVTGLFHADPHPGNVFATPEGKLAMLDFGMVKRLPEHVREGLMKETFGGYFNRPKLYVDGLIQKGAIGERDREVTEQWAKKTFADPAARGVIFDHDPKHAGAVKSLVSGLKDLVELESFQTPLDNVMFMRALGIVIDVCKEVAPETSPSELAAPVMLPILMKFMEDHPEYAASEE